MLNPSMPSLEHTALVGMFRNSPELIPRLLSQLGVPVPSHDTVTVSEATLDQLLPIEFRADLIVELRDASSEHTRLSTILEVQLHPDADKHFSWPAYLVLHRSRQRCDTCVVVLAPDPAVAAWARRPIRLGPGNELRVLVLGPAEIPTITDPAEAAANPSLTVLSAIAHGNEPEHGLPLLRLAIGALKTFDNEDAEICLHLITRALGEPMRAAMNKEAMLREQFPDVKLEFPGFVTDMVERGKIGVKAEILLKIVDHAGIKLTAEQRETITTCEDTARLDAWIDRAFTAKTAAELFD
jgi:hypothetical protein